MIVSPEPTYSIKDKILKSSVRRTLDLIGDRWTLLVLLGSFYGFDRFDHWVRNYNISSSVLSARIKRLQRNDLLVKRQIEGSLRYRYVLTAAGKDLFAWAMAVWHWEDEWLYQEEGHPVSLTHTTCGATMRPVYECAHCQEHVEYMDIHIEEGPGLESEPASEAPVFRRSVVKTDQGLGRIADLIGDRWSYLVISAALFRVRRFDDFQNELEIAPSVLTDRLRRLVEHGLLARSRYRNQPARWEYLLTEKTYSFAMVPLMLGLWGDRWLTLEHGPPALRFHRRCENPLKLRVLCSYCREPLDCENVMFDQEKSTTTS